MSGERLQALKEVVVFMVAIAYLAITFSCTKQRHALKVQGTVHKIARHSTASVLCSRRDYGRFNRKQQSTIEVYPHYMLASLAYTFDEPRTRGPTSRSLHDGMNNIYECTCRHDCSDMKNPSTCTGYSHGKYTPISRARRESEFFIRRAVDSGIGECPFL